MRCVSQDVVSVIDQVGLGYSMKALVGMSSKQSPFGAVKGLLEYIIDYRMIIFPSSHRQLKDPQAAKTTAGILYDNFVVHYGAAAK